MSSNRNEDQIEIKGLKKTPSTFKNPANESQDEKDDIEESNSLKPSTKEELKNAQKNNKVSPDDDSKKANAFKKKVTYLNVTSEELKELNISQWRINIANFMRSKPVDIFIIVLIILYTLLVIVYLAIEDLIDDEKSVETTLQIVELVFLFIFWVEITLNLIGFGILFLKDYWNIADITVILLAIAFVILDMTLEDSNLSGIFRLRGLFRLLRVGILIRKFDAIRKKSAARKKMHIRDIYHVSTPAEVVNEILCEVRDMIVNDDKLVEDMNYCIKMVNSGKIYEANIDENAEGGDENQKQAISFFKSYQGNKAPKERKNSMDIRKGIENIIDTIDLNERLELTAKSKNMMEKANTLKFDIFDFKESTNDKGKHFRNYNTFRAFCDDFISDAQT